FVIEDDNVGRGELVKAHRFANGTPAFIHIGHGHQHDRLFAPEAAFRNKPLKAGAEGRKGMAANDRVRRHESDIVPVPGVFLAGISKTDEQNHRRLPSGSEAQPSFFSDSAAFSSCFASLSAETTAAGAAMVATVKSRSVMVGVTPFGRFTLEMWIESPISRPVRSISICSGMAFAGQESSIS